MILTFQVRWVFFLQMVAVGICVMSVCVGCRQGRYKTGSRTGSHWEIRPCPPSKRLVREETGRVCQVAASARRFRGEIGQRSPVEAERRFPDEIGQRSLDGGLRRFPVEIGQRSPVEAEPHYLVVYTPWRPAGSDVASQKRNHITWQVESRSSGRVALVEWNLH